MLPSWFSDPWSQHFLSKSKAPNRGNPSFHTEIHDHQRPGWSKVIQLVGPSKVDLFGHSVEHLLKKCALKNENSPIFLKEIGGKSKILEMIVALETPSFATKSWRSDHSQKPYTHLEKKLMKFYWVPYWSILGITPFAEIRLIQHLFEEVFDLQIWRSLESWGNRRDINSLEWQKIRLKGWIKLVCTVHEEKILRYADMPLANMLHRYYKIIINRNTLLLAMILKTDFRKKRRELIWMDTYSQAGPTSWPPFPTNSELREVAHLGNSEGSRRCRRFWPPGNLPFNRDPYNGSLQSLWNWITSKKSRKKKNSKLSTLL